MKKIILLLLIAAPGLLYAQSAQNANVETAIRIVNDIKEQQYEALKSLIAPASLGNLNTAVFKQIREVMAIKDGEVQTGEFVASTYKEEQILKADILNKSINTALVCVFNNDHQLLRIYLEPHNYGKGKYKDAAYADAALYDEQLIVVQTGEFILPGILTIPKGKKKYPVLVFVHGSGINDRDEALFALKPFRDMALGLAAKGIATLRYDKRNKIYNTADVHDGRQLTMEDETTDDAASAIKLALTLPNVSRVFVIGHSQGGMMLPQIVSENPKLSGGIVMSGPSISLLQSYANQYHTVAMDEPTRTAALKDIELIKNADTISNQSKILLSKPAFFWTNLSSYNQLEVVKSLKQPLLFLQGGRDYQVAPADVDIWQNAANGNRDVTVKKYPKLNHFYTEGTGPSTSNEYFTPANVPAYVIDDIATWILKH